MRKLLCLSLCSVPTHDQSNVGAERSLLQIASPSRRMRKKSFLQPSSTAVCRASILLTRFAQNFPTFQEDQRSQIEHWRHAYTLHDTFTNTPLQMWADAIPARFSTIWDLLAFQPSGELDVEQPWPASGVEFWMQPGARTHATIHAPEEDHDETACSISEGAWRTLSALTCMCHETSMQKALFSQLKSEEDWNTMFKLIFAFRLEKMASNRYDQEAFDEMAKHANTTVGLFLLVCECLIQLGEYTAPNAAYKAQFEKMTHRYLRVLDQTSLEVFCEVRIPSHQDKTTGYMALSQHCLPARIFNVVEELSQLGRYRYTSKYIV